MQIHTEGRDFIAGGHVYHADPDGNVEIPDHIAKAEGLTPHERDDKPGTIPASAQRDKKALVDWAKEAHGLDIDPESGTKAELIARIEAEIAAKQ